MPRLPSTEGAAENCSQGHCPVQQALGQTERQHLSEDFEACLLCPTNNNNHNNNNNNNNNKEDDNKEDDNKENECGRL
jgi:hypothetical protein